jgi:mobilization protein
MVVEFFKSNKNNIRQAFRYLLDDRVEQKTSRILSGDVAEAVKIADATRNKIKYYSGVLSFKENPDFLSIKQKYEIIDDFEKTMIPDESLREKLNWTWIEHSDKGRLELNFVVNTKFDDIDEKIRPETFNFYHKFNQDRLSVFQDFVDLKYGCASAKDGKPSLEYLKTKKFNKEKSSNDINALLENIILKNPSLKTRDDLLSHLETHESDKFKITRTSKNFFSLTQIGEKKPTRITIKNDINLDEYREKLVNNQIGLQNSKISANLVGIQEKLEKLNQITAQKQREKYYGEYRSTSSISKQHIENFRKKAAIAAAECTTPSNEKIGCGRNSDERDGRPVFGSVGSSASELAEFVQKTKQEQYVGRKIESFGEQVDRFRDEFGNVNRSIGRYWEYTRVASRSVERIEQRRLTKKWGGGGFDKLIEKYKSDKKELKSECYEKKREIFITKNQIRHCENRIERIKKQLGEITGQNARVSTSHRPLLEDMSEDEFIAWFNNELIRYMDANEAAARAARMRLLRLKSELMALQNKRDELNKCYINLNSDYKKLIERHGQLYQKLQEDIARLKVGGQTRKKPAYTTGYLNIR